jgi:hypothetical protein
VLVSKSQAMKENCHTGTVENRCKGVLCYTLIPEEKIKGKYKSKVSLLHIN